MKRLITVLILFWGASSFAGGETGNAFKSYINTLAQFKASYPRTWVHFECESSIQFSENDSKDRASVTIFLDHRKEIKNLEDLKKNLSKFQAPGFWQELELGGKKGFQAAGEQSGLLVLLKEAGTLLFIEYELGKDPINRPTVQYMISSFEFI